MSGVVNHRPRWPDAEFASASSKKALFLVSSCGSAIEKSKLSKGEQVEQRQAHTIHPDVQLS